MAPEAVKRFFSSPQFAVAGASQDEAKFGYKLLAWYHRRTLPVTPINMKKPAIAVGSGNSKKTYQAVGTVGELSAPTQTSLSIVTPPKVTRGILEEAKQLQVPAVWLQPGTYDAEVLEFARENFEAAVGGTDDYFGPTYKSRGGSGWCVLVDGEDGLAAAEAAKREDGANI